jgi:hypothetical protein
LRNKRFTETGTPVVVFPKFQIQPLCERIGPSGPVIIFEGSTSRRVFELRYLCFSTLKGLKMFRQWLACCLAMLVLGSAMADAPKKKNKGAKGSPVSGILKQLEKASIELSEEQKTAIAEKGQAMQAKLKAVQEEHQLTPTEMKAVAEASKAARESGKKGKELEAVAFESAGLTDTQKEGMTKINALRSELTQEVIALLTDDQKANLPKQLTKGAGGNKKKNK